MTHICVMSSQKPIRTYMEGLILCANTLYRLFYFFKLFPMVGKGITPTIYTLGTTTSRLLGSLSLPLVQGPLPLPFPPHCHHLLTGAVAAAEQTSTYTPPCG